MNRTWARIGIAATALLSAGCDALNLGPHRADSAPAAPAPQPGAPPELRQAVGETYPVFVAEPGRERYRLENLGLSEAEQARLEAAMAVPAPAPLAAGGGAEALVFAGCAESGCEAGMGVVAVDLTTGAVFVGVRDGEGQTEFVPNARLEALLRLTSQSRRWDDPIRAQPATAPP
jgi:hypothetical protein